MVIPERRYDSSTYRFGFNGKENDNEVKGRGNQQEYGMRIYDTRYGKFLSIDPLAIKYPFYSPYQFASNCPSFAIDVDGLEADLILNKAETLLKTPYEYGGKNPNPDLIGLLGTDEGEAFWNTKLRPKLQLISDYHPDHHHPEKGICDEKNVKEMSKEIKAYVYREFSQFVKNYWSLGIDCSGYVYTSYTADKQLLFDGEELNTGSEGQLNAFKNAASEGKAYVHHNFNLISAGDFVKLPGHVVIATGKVRRDKNGNVTEYQTYEAQGTSKGSKMNWRKPNSSNTIGHPFRTSDTGGKKEVHTVWGANLEVNIATPSSDPETRTKDNLQQSDDNNDKKTTDKKKAS